MNLGHLSRPQKISGGAILVVALAAFLPWVSIFGIGVTGIQGDGVLTLAGAVVGAVVLAVTTGVVGSTRTPGRVSEVALLVLAILVSLIALLDMNGAAAIGLYLTLLGGLAWVASAAPQLKLSKQQATSAERVQEQA
jgi:hypothetical protein